MELPFKNRYPKPATPFCKNTLQKHLVAEVDGSTTGYTALPELRCTFSGRSIVPDIAVIAWDRIRLSETGEPEDDFTAAPDWIIEILCSPIHYPRRMAVTPVGSSTLPRSTSA